VPAERGALASASLEYIAVALLWLRLVDGIALTRWDALGAALALGGMAVIALQPRA
jgi:small multidrug resistance family-3 protein